MTGKYPRTCIITTAQMGGDPFRKFIAGLETRAGRRGEMFVLPVNGALTGKRAKEDILDSYIPERFAVIEGNLQLNANAYIMRDIPVKAEAANPLDKCSRHAHIGKTVIVGSPKIRMKVYADEEEKAHKILTSTGAVTHPYYASTERGQVAKLDHQYGAIILEIESNQKYHMRQLNADASGVFYDLGYRYDGDKKPVFERLEAIVLGDWHESYNPQEVINATEKMIKQLQPKKIFIHDLFDGDAISYFHEEDVGYKAKETAEGKNLLTKALKACWERLVWFRQICPEDTQIYVVKSNHDERLWDYVRKGKYSKDYPNSAVGSRLFAEMTEHNEDPLHFGIRYYGGAIPEGVHFLQRADRMKVVGWTLSAHGDKGPGGRKATTNTLSNGYNFIIAAHLHSPEIFRNVFRAGTSTRLQMMYTEGSTVNWMNSHVLLPKNSRPQIVNIIDGRYQP